MSEHRVYTDQNGRFDIYAIGSNGGHVTDAGIKDHATAELIACVRDAQAAVSRAIRALDRV